MLYPLFFARAHRFTGTLRNRPCLVSSSLWSPRCSLDSPRRSLAQSQVCLLSSANDLSKFHAHALTHMTRVNFKFVVLLRVPVYIRCRSHIYSGTSYVSSVYEKNDMISRCEDARSNGHIPPITRARDILYLHQEQYQQQKKQCYSNPITLVAPAAATAYHVSMHHVRDTVPAVLPPQSMREGVLLFCVVLPESRII